MEKRRGENRWYFLAQYEVIEAIEAAAKTTKSGDKKTSGQSEISAHLRLLRPSPQSPPACTAVRKSFDFLVAFWGVKNGFFGAKNGFSGGQNWLFRIHFACN
jgi:hypothetical protein